MKNFWEALSRHAVVILLVSIIIAQLFACFALMGDAARWMAIADAVEQPKTCPACGSTIYIVLEQGPSDSSTVD